MTALADLLSRADRRRLLERARELDELDDLMRRPGLLASPSGQFMAARNRYERALRQAS